MDERARRMGIADLLMAYARTCSNRWVCRRCLVDRAGYAHSAHRLYERRGYVRQPQRKRLAGRQVQPIGSPTAAITNHSTSTQCLTDASSRSLHKHDHGLTAPTAHSTVITILPRACPCSTWRRPSAVSSGYVRSRTVSFLSAMSPVRVSSSSCSAWSASGRSRCRTNPRPRPPEAQSTAPTTRPGEPPALSTRVLVGVTPGAAGSAAGCPLSRITSYGAWVSVKSSVV